MKKAHIIFMLSIVIWASCNKDEGKTTTPSPSLTKTQMITAKSWKMTGATLDGVDKFQQQNECTKDNLYFFKEDFTFILDHGATKCQPNNSQIITTDVWRFLDNESALYYAGDTSQIQELTASKMVLKDNISGSEVIITYTAQ